MIIGLVAAFVRRFLIKINLAPWPVDLYFLSAMGIAIKNNDMIERDELVWMIATKLWRYYICSRGYIGFV